jgi:hypothetical protein
MTFEELKASLSGDDPPAELSGLLEAMWQAGKGNWNAAHRLVQDLSGANAAWVHAYLHREEGDRSNANYWYRRANRSMPDLSLEEEWAQITAELLQSA